jgi:hypothetical protein
VPEFDVDTNPAGRLGYAQMLASRGASVKGIASRMGSYHASLHLEEGQEPSQEPSGMDTLRAARRRLRKQGETPS